MTDGFRKHVYEIARMKSEEERWQMVDMQEICERVVDEAYQCGVHVSSLSMV